MLRILIEKHVPFDREARELLKEIHQFLNVPSISSIRYFVGYDIQGLDRQSFENYQWRIAQKGIEQIFYDSVPKEKPNPHPNTTSITFEDKQGQYNQKADSTEQILRTCFPDKKITVTTFQHIILSGKPSSAEVERIRSYLINPINMQSKDLDIPSLVSFTPPEKIVESLVGFILADKQKLINFKKYADLAMDLDNLSYCQDYFCREGRDPTITELKILDVYWSDHCRHSTFNTVLNQIEFEKNEFTSSFELAVEQWKEDHRQVYGDKVRPHCLMDLATLSMKRLRKQGQLTGLEQSDEVNACSIETKIAIDGLEHDYIVMFKNETHNHPTELEPFGGASTCLGGAIRDPLSGRANVFGAIRVTGSGNPLEFYEQTLQGKLPQRKINQQAAQGYSSYGNQIGIAAAHFMDYYDPGFKAKRMECGAVVGAVAKSNVRRESAIEGDVIILLGAPTGRDGCGGATGSSKEQAEDALQVLAAEVQKGNPVIERKMLKLFARPEVACLIKKCNDFGAGGVSVAVGEMADGLQIHLERVPVKYEGLNATELAISESQERMAILVDKNDVETFCTYAFEEDLNAVAIAYVTGEKRLKIYYQDEKIVDLDSAFLNSGGIRASINVKVEAPKWQQPSLEPITHLSEQWLAQLKQPGYCSQKGQMKYFDDTIGNASVFVNFGGQYQRTQEQGLAMRIPLVTGTTDSGVVMTVGYHPDYTYQSPFHAGAYALIESISKVVAMGGDYKSIYLSLQEYFERLGADSAKWGKPFAALMGAYWIQRQLGLAAIGGKDSMSGSYENIHVPPSLISFALAVVNTQQLVSRAFKKTESYIIRVSTPLQDDGLPDLVYYQQNLKAIHSLIKKNQVLSSSVIGRGGLVSTISEMAMGNEIGFKFEDKVSFNLFEPCYADILLEVDTLPDNKYINYQLIGKTIADKKIVYQGEKITLAKIISAWESPMESIFPDKEVLGIAARNGNQLLSEQKNTSTQQPILVTKSKKPLVVIPIFPGTNGEIALARQFSLAGAEVKTVLIHQLTPIATLDSFKYFANMIESADIIALPSGLTLGGEPAGTAKFISLMLLHPLVKSAMNYFVKERQGFVLGLGESFKALIETGLITHGEIVDNWDEDLFLVRNHCNHFYSGIVQVQNQLVNSPWLANLKGQKELLPCAIEDGSISCSPERYRQLKTNGQIVACYSPITHSVMGELCRNPFESDYAIEALMSPNGRIIGRIGAIDRLEPGLYRNVFDAKVHPFFNNIVSLFNA